MNNSSNSKVGKLPKKPKRKFPLQLIELHSGEKFEGYVMKKTSSSAVIITKQKSTIDISGKLIKSMTVIKGVCINGIKGLKNTVADFFDKCDLIITNGMVQKLKAY